MAVYLACLLALLSANALALPQMGAVIREENPYPGYGGGPFGYPNERVVQEEEEPCENIVAVFELYNVTQKTLTEMKNTVPNITIWDSGAALFPTNGNFEDPSWSRVETLDVVDNQEIPDETNGANASSSIFDAVLVGVPTNHTNHFLEVLNVTGIKFKDMHDRLCVVNANESAAAVIGEPNQLDFPNIFSIPAHITTSLYPNFFYNLIVSEPDPAFSGAPKPTQTPKVAPFTLQSSTPFSYYIGVDKSSGLIKLEHGNVPSNPSSGWAWVPTADNAKEYTLVNQLKPDQKVILGADGVLTVSPSDNDAEGLKFSLTFSGPEFTIWTKSDDKTYCMVQYFAVTIRLMPIPNPESSPEAKLCTKFKLQLKEVSVVSGRHNTTFIDLYNSWNSEWIDLEQVTRGGQREIITTSVDASAMLYFSSPPTGLYIMLSGSYVSTPVKDLRRIANRYLERKSVCREAFLPSEQEAKPVLNCLFSHREQEVIENGSKDAPAAAAPRRGSKVGPGLVYRQNITHVTKVQVFRDYVRFQFLAEGMGSCGASGAQCARKISVQENMVTELMNEMGIGYSNIVRGTGEGDKDNLYYWMEGVVSFSNTTVVPIFLNSKGSSGK